MRKLLTILLMLVSLSMGATKIYIDEGGNDGTGDGSSGNPYLTPAYAISQASSGDTVFINAGTYNVSAQIELPVGISIMGEGETSIIVSTYAASGTRDGAIYLNSAAGAPVNGNQSISYINLNGSSLTSNRAIAVNYRYNVEIHHCIIEDFDKTGVWFYVGTAYDHATGNSVNNCIINNSSSAIGGYAGCIRFEGQDGFLVYNNTVDMRFREAGTNSASMNSDNNVRYQIYDNTFYRNDHEDDNWNFFMEMWSYEGDCQIYNNTFYGLATIDFAFGPTTLADGTTYGLKVYNNRMLNDANGIYTKPSDTKAIIGITIEGDGHQSVYVYNNLIQRYGWGIEICSAASSTGGTWEQDWHFNDIYIYYNIISDVGYSDYQYCYGFIYLNETNSDGYTTETDNLHILNNTITAIAGSTYQGIRLSGNNVLTNLNIQNNIVKGFDSYGIYLGEHATDGFAITNCDVTYNCMNGNGTNSVGIDGDIAQTNFDVATGNITTAPEFKSESTYRLTPTSGCVDAGVDVSLNYDYYGHKITGTPDIGAMEHGRYIMVFR